MSSPLVSIIIPAYNAEKYLAETVTSALNQTWPNKEIIIVDDGSSDNSVEIAKGFANAGVKVFQQKNKGSGATRNKGLAEAKGDYVQFLDADDLLSTGKISDQVNLLIQNPGKVAVCSTVHFFSDADPYDGKPSAYEDSFLHDSDNPAEFLSILYGGKDNQGSMIQTNAWLTPMSVIKEAGNWSEFYSPDDDGEFFCRVVLASKGIVYARDCFNYYRKHRYSDNLASSKTVKAMQGKFKSFLLKKDNLLKVSNAPITKKALAHSAMGLAVDAYLVDKKLTDQIIKVIEELGGTDYIPKLGGSKIELLRKMFGWKTALRLQYFYSKFKKQK